MENQPQAIPFAGNKVKEVEATFTACELTAR